MSQITNKITEYRRFPFWGTLFGGIFLLFLIRLYWDPTLATSVSGKGKSEVWLSQQYAVWGPIWKYGFERINKGEVPHWNPYQLCGRPYLTDIRTALFQPLHFLFWRMDFASAYQWYIFLAFSLLGIGFLIWGRILEIPYPALLPGLVSFLFSGPIICAQMSLPLLSGSVWLIFLFSGIVYYLEQHSSRTFLVLIFLWVSLIFSGSIECIFVGFLCLLIFPVIFQRFPTVTPQQHSPYITLKTAGIVILGLTICSFTILPFIAWFITSGEQLDSYLSFPLSVNFPETFYQALYYLFLPILSVEPPEIPILYPGLICIVFIIPALFDREYRSIVLFHICLILSFFILFFINLDFTRILQKGMIFPLILSFSTLSGIGLQRLLLKGRDVSSPYVWVSGAFVFISLILIILISNPWIKGVSILLLFLLIPATLLRIPKGNFVLCILISLLGFIELYYLFRPFIPESYVTTIQRQEAFSEFIHQLRYQTGTGRGFIISSPNTFLWSENLGMYYHWQLLNGKELPQDKHSRLWTQTIQNHNEDKLEILNHPIITISGVQWAFTINNQVVHSEEKEIKNWRKMEQNSLINIYENTCPLPRCFWISNYKVITTLEESLKMLQDSNFSPFRECLVLLTDSIPYKKTTLKPIPTVLEESTETTIVPATIQQETPEYMSIQVHAPKEGFLVLLDSFTPNWIATLDGEPVQIFPTNGIFRGIPLPGGVHHITFQYTTPLWIPGKILSLSAVIFTFIIYLLKKLYNKKI